MKLQISQTEINDFYDSLKTKNVGEQIVLDKRTLDVLIAVFGTVAFIAQLLSKGCRIDSIRKLLNIYPAPKKPDVDNENQEVDSDNAPSEDSKDSDAAPSKDPAPTSAEAEKGSQTADSDKPNKKNKNHPGKSGVDDYPNAKQIEHSHDWLKPGDICPECGKGKVYPSPRETLQFVAGPLIEPVVYKFNDLTCNLCKAPFKVKLSEELKKEGVCQGGQFTFSAISMIALLKYFFCLPLYRTQYKGAWLGVEIPRSTQQDQIENLVNVIHPLAKYLLRAAADAKKFFSDDTTAKILTKKSELKIPRGSTQPILRDGGHSSVALAYTEQENPIVLVKTDIIHSGEFMDEILSNRTNPSTPMIMWDRLSSNKVTVCDYIDLACMQHARKNFHDLLSDDPKYIKPILAEFKAIFKNESETKDMKPAERLSYHQEKSEPHFQNILDMAKNAIEEKKYLPNSELGRACNYFINHSEALGKFLSIEGAELHVFV